MGRAGPAPIIPDGMLTLVISPRGMFESAQAGHAHLAGPGQALTHKQGVPCTHKKGCAVCDGQHGTLMVAEGGRRGKG